jgi:hypothetical protein
MDQGENEALILTMQNKHLNNIFFYKHLNLFYIWILYIYK